LPSIPSSSGERGTGWKGWQLRVRIPRMADRKAIQTRLESLKKLYSQMEKTIIADKTTKDYLLRSASNSLGDVERYLIPQAEKANPNSAAMWLGIAEFELSQAEARLKYAQNLVSTYGPKLQAIG
jgi:hypothetical protein